MKSYKQIKMKKKCQNKKIQNKKNGLFNKCMINNKKKILNYKDLKLKNKSRTSKMMKYYNKQIIIMKIIKLNCDQFL